MIYTLEFIIHIHLYISTCILVEVVYNVFLSKYYKHIISYLYNLIYIPLSTFRLKMV